MENDEDPVWCLWSFGMLASLLRLDGDCLVDCLDDCFEVCLMDCLGTVLELSWYYHQEPRVSCWVLEHHESFTETLLECPNRMVTILIV